VHALSLRSRNSAADPFVLPAGGGAGGAVGANNEAFFTRVGEPQPDDFGLGSELKELSGVVSKTVFPTFL
jgi:hypothetical protein